VESLGQCTHSHLVVTPLLLNLLNVNPDKIQATTTNAMTMTIITITIPARGLLETFHTGTSVRTHTRPAHALAHPSESPNVVYAIVRTPSTISTLLIPDLTLKVMVNVGKEKTKCKSARRRQFRGGRRLSRPRCFGTRGSVGSYLSDI